MKSSRAFQKILAVYQGFSYHQVMVEMDLLVFDLDGTLCDTKDDLATAVNLTLKELGLPLKRPEEIYGYVGSGVRKLLAQAVGEESGERFKEALRIFRRHYLDHLLDTTRPYPGMERVLEHFGEKKKAVVTNKPQDYTDRIMEGLGLTRHFDRIIGSVNGLSLKPEPQMVLMVLEGLKIRKDRAVMIGDGLHDIVAARSAGIKVCAVGYGLGNVQGLKEARPDFFCARPEDLAHLFV